MCAAQECVLDRKRVSLRNLLVQSDARLCQHRRVKTGIYGNPAGQRRTLLSAEKWIRVRGRGNDNLAQPNTVQQQGFPSRGARKIVVKKTEASAYDCPLRSSRSPGERQSWREVVVIVDGGLPVVAQPRRQCQV